jgi:hypothetical protein
MFLMANSFLLFFAGSDQVVDTALHLYCTAITLPRVRPINLILHEGPPYLKA